MPNQPIDPRALKAAEEINRIAAESEDLLSGDRLARIIQSHFAESVNVRVGSIVREIYTASLIANADNSVRIEWLREKISEANSLLDSAQPCMADELAEALEASLAEHKEVLGFLTNRISQGESVFQWKEQTEAIIKKIEDAQKGQS